jgi:hypothetical protein
MEKSIQRAGVKRSIPFMAVYVTGNFASRIFLFVPCAMQFDHVLWPSKSFKSGNVKSGQVAPMRSMQRVKKNSRIIFDKATY